MAQFINLYGVQTLKPTINNDFTLVYDKDVRPENNNEVRILVDTSLQVVPAPVNIFLPPTGIYNGQYALQIYVVDIIGSAASQPINIFATGGDTIDGLPSVSITTALGNCVLTIASLGFYTTYGSTGGGGGGGGAGITLPYADFFDLQSAGQLQKGQTYRINDYRNVNFLNGNSQANFGNTTYPLNAGSFDGSFAYNTLTPAFGNVKLAICSDDSIITGNALGQLYKFDSNGNPNTNFNNNAGAKANAGINCVLEQADGKVLVGGSFTLWGATPVGYFVRLNADGTLDNAFNTTLGLGFDGRINCVDQQADGKILIGGNFTLINGVASSKCICRLLPTGAPDVVFNTNLGAGADFELYTILECSTTDIVFGGIFTQVDGNASPNISRVDNTGSLDFGFIGSINFAGGFNGSINFILEDNLQNLYVGGNFNNWNGNLYAFFCKMDVFGNDDFAYNANTGFGLDNTPNGMILQNTGEIVMVGGFTSFNLAPSIGIVRVDATGLYDPSFISQNIVFESLAQQSTGKLIVTGAFNFISVANNMARLFGQPTNAVWQRDEIYTSSNLETIVVRALDEFNIEPTAYSETYPEDILEYTSQCNKIGTGLSITNGSTLPDSTIVAGFDLQWDGTKAYFNMPAGYPAQFGHFFYIYADFSAGAYYLDFVFEPLKCGTSSYTYTYSPFNSTITVSANGDKVFLNDLTQQDVLNYTPNTLYVDTINALGNAYGWITRRIDTARDIDLPIDFRGQVFRRYFAVFPSFQGFFNINYAGSIGFYEDFSVLPKDIQGGSEDSTSIQLLGQGGADGYYWYAGRMDNVVFLEQINDVNGTIRYFQGNTFQYCIQNSLNGYVWQNRIRNFTGNSFRNDGTSTISENVLYDCTNNVVDSLNFNNNNLYGTLNGNQILGSFQLNNGTGTIAENFFGDGGGFVQNTITSVNFNQNILYYFAQNTINCQIFLLNKLYTFVNSQVASACQTFSKNTIQSCNNLNAQALQIFENTAGYDFNNNLITGSFFQNNIFGDTCTLNNFSYVQFKNNVFGNLCGNNNFFAGGSSFNNNTCGNSFSTNNLQANNITNNKFGENCSGNTLNGNNITDNVMLGLIQGNVFAGNTQFNTITCEFLNNSWFGASNFMDNSLTGNSCNFNTIQSSFNVNNITGSMNSCTLPAGQTFRYNTITAEISGVNFAAATFVFANYNKTITTGNANTDLLIYWDEATNQFLAVLPTA